MRFSNSAACVFILLLALMGCSSMAGEVVVPDVTGLNEAEAVQALEVAGLVASAAVAEGADERAGTVVGQDPEPGSRVETGSTITLRVAREG